LIKNGRVNIFGLVALSQVLVCDRVARWYVYFFKQINQIWEKFEDIAMEAVGIFYVHLVHFTAIWYTLRPFAIFYGHLVYFLAIRCIFSRFGALQQEKSGNPG
jgi:hypothetical protein